MCIVGRYTQYNCTPRYLSIALHTGIIVPHNYVIMYERLHCLLQEPNEVDDRVMVLLLSGI